MTRIILTTLAIVLGVAVQVGQSAHAESSDRTESPADRAGCEMSGQIDRIERLSIGKPLHNTHGGSVN